eukprot:1846692-Amphidinium_carterae.1
MLLKLFKQLDNDNARHSSSAAQFYSSLAQRCSACGFAVDFFVGALDQVLARKQLSQNARALDDNHRGLFHAQADSRTSYEMSLKSCTTFLLPQHAGGTYQHQDLLLQIH